MKQKVTMLLASLGVISSLLAPVFVSANVYAAGIFDSAKRQACSGATLNDTNCDPNAGTTRVNSTLAAVINILSLVLGVISVIMIIIGGIRFTTSGGDGNSTAAARNTIIYAVIGIVVATMAQVIVRFVLGRVSA